MHCALGKGSFNLNICLGKSPDFGPPTHPTPPGYFGLIQIPDFAELN